MTPLIRLADQNDVAELVRLRLAYFQEEFQHVTKYLYFQQVKQIRQSSMKLVQLLLS